MAEVDECPYQGLAPFDADRKELFFGRAGAIRNLLARLGPRLDGRGSILLVSGASGAGKSSLLRAGLLPALAEGRLPVAGSRDWSRLLMTPTSCPLRALAETWAHAFGGNAGALLERLRSDPGAVSAPGRLILVIDQFEELFTLVAGEQERQAFVQVLHVLAEGPQEAAVIIGLRADYWDRCAAYPEFAEAIQDGQVIVEPMTESDLRLAITGPAATAGLELAPGLVEAILAELRTDRAVGDRYEVGTLPLLSQALLNTWERRENGQLTIRGYEESGRVRDSVRRTADEVLGRLASEDRKTALRLFRRMTLITTGGRPARRRATRAEIHAAASADSAEDRSRVDALLSAFAAQRLLTLDEETVEIAHDALLTAWPALWQWIKPDLQAQAVYDRLIEDATQWADHHRDSAFLYRGARLLSVQESRPRWGQDPGSFPPPGPAVEVFVAASVRAARRAGRRRRLVVVGLTVLSILAITAAGLAVRAANDADHQRDLAVSRQLAAQSEIAGDPPTSALLAVAAWRIAPTPEARHRLLVAAASTGRGTLTGHRSFVRALAFGANGKIIATGGADGTARLWDTSSRRQLGAPIIPPRQECASDLKMALSPDGRMLVTACLGTVRFWDVSTRRQRGAPLDTGSVVSAISIGPDGSTLATGSLHGTLRLWDVATRGPRGDTIGRADTRSGFPSAINAVVFSTDGRRLASAGEDGKVRLWDTASFAQAGTSFTGHVGAVNDVSFSPDGTTLATAGTDGTARLWNMATHRQTGSRLADPNGKAALFSIAFSPDGTRVATAGGDGRTRLWDTASHQEIGTALAANFSAVRRVAFSPDGRLLAAAGDDGVVRLGDPVVHQQIGSPMPGQSAIALSPDGRTMATGGPSEADPAVRLWDVATRHLVGRPLKPAGGPSVVHAITFGPDGRTLAVAGSDGVRIWDTAGGRQIGPPIPESGRIGAVEVSPGGRFLAAQRDMAISFWAVAARREIGARLRVPGHTEVVSAMAISPDGATLATAGADRTVRLFDVATRHQIGAPLPVTTDGLWDDLAFSPDGRTLATTSGDSTVRLWDVTRRRPLGTPLIGHTDVITAMAFSPDGRSVVTGSADNTVLLWDLPTYRQIGAPLTGHTRAVSGIAYSPGGTKVATVSKDGSARLWDVGLPADPAATACASAGRSFTRAEWERYMPQEKFRQICP
jgi:WD40 repeat protein